MRIFKANYWLALFYNGIVLGIWPGAALAFLVTHFVFGSNEFALFVVTFIGFTALIVVLVMLSYHFFVWRRRPRPQAVVQKPRKPKLRKSKLTVVR